MPKGMDLIRKAVELRPNDGDIVDSLGWAYYQQGHYDEALTELEGAIDLKPLSWEINDHLGDVYWKVGRKLDAKFQWLHALTYDVDPDKRSLIERKIRDGLESVEAESEQKRGPGGDGGEAAPKPASPAPLKLPENRTEGQPQPNHASVEGPTETR
jgi:tetratricopeptide (TPR) repeat protein